MMTRAAALFALFALPCSSAFYAGLPLGRLRGGAPAMAAQPGIAVIVDAEIVEERLEEFKELIKVDAIGSREEPGCLRFDVLQDMANPCRFFFYEAYVDAAAVDTHKTMPHFKPWVDFKDSGGCKSLSTKAIPLGDWGFQ